jgi:hypothetical protein
MILAEDVSYHLRFLIDSDSTPMSTESTMMNIISPTAMAKAVISVRRLYLVRFLKAKVMMNFIVTSSGHR